MKVFEFSDYKRFLKHYIENQPRKGRGLVKSIGEHLNVDPSQISQVLSGSKDFTEEHGLLLTRFIGLNELETEYFLTLLKIERSGTKTLKDHYAKKLEKLKVESLNLKERINQDRILGDYEKSVFYSSYLYCAIWLSTSINEGQALADIAERFQISRQKTAGILNFLVDTQLCIEKNGLYTMGTQHIHVERGSPFLSRHHHNWRIKGLERTESISEEEMQFTGPVSISKKDFLAIRELLLDAISKTLQKVKQSEPSDVACLLIDWYWLKK